MSNPPSAAQALFGHLPSASREPVQQRQPNIGDAMWPNLSREAKAQDAQRQRWDEWRKRQRDSVLRGLRELNRKIDARLARER